MRVINERYPGVDSPRWYTNDIAPRFIADRHEDAATPAAWRDLEYLAAVVTNPPFSLAQEIIPRALQAAPIVISLLRLSWLEVTHGRQWLARRPPDSIIVMDRYSFDHSGNVDNVCSAWFLWGITLDPPIQCRPGKGRFAGELMPAEGVSTL